MSGCACYLPSSLPHSVPCLGCPCLDQRTKSFQVALVGALCSLPLAFIYPAAFHHAIKGTHPVRDAAIGAAGCATMVSHGHIYGNGSRARLSCFCDTWPRVRCAVLEENKLCSSLGDEV